MALITCDFFSESLEFGQSMTVVLPQATEAQVGVTSAGGIRNVFFTYSILARVSATMSPDGAFVSNTYQPR